ncbi:hypothetical protein [Shewanella woodyi]|uniref:hypothetical protein n=1 Tax=Shewanella woodyi TaxID=60961 RepID=UPI003747FA7B
MLLSFFTSGGGLVTVKNQGDYEILKDAYRETFNWKEQGYDKPSYDVFMTTMIFGFSDKKIIDGGSNLTTYLKYLKVSSQLNAYSSLSGMIKKLVGLNLMLMMKLLIVLLKVLGQLDIYITIIMGGTSSIMIIIA